MSANARVLAVPEAQDVDAIASLTDVRVCTGISHHPSSLVATMWFTRKHSPTIVNLTKHTIVVFQERGFLYNKQVLLPGEAVTMTPSQTTGHVPLLPYHVHAVVGDERNLPTRQDSVNNLVSVSIIPAAFIVAALATAASAGTLAGPSAALAPMVSGMVVKGVVIDSAALAAGAVAASRITYLSELLLKKHPTKFMAKSGRMLPGKNFVIVTGGMDDGNLTISTIRERRFRKLGIKHLKEPTDTIKEKIHYYIPVLAPSKKSQAALPSSAVPPTEEPVPMIDNASGLVHPCTNDMEQKAAATLPQKKKMKRRWICCCWI
jgi:hypothetical protein